MKRSKIFRGVSVLNRKQKDPDKFIFTGHRTIGKMDIQLFLYNKETCLEDHGLETDHIDRFEGNGFRYWLNIHGLNNTEDIAAICEKQEIHGLVVQDILDMIQVMKTLTIIATIFIPLTFIAGIYGMNFSYMTELEWKAG